MKALLFFILLVAPLPHYCQEEYGNNSIAGNYYDVGDAKIYYEVYGSGTPLILLHGAIYGYIDDFSEFIPTFSKSFKVIAIASRGHGKSEIGTKNYSEKLLAQDVISILDHESEGSAIVIGFSAGAAIAYHLAAHHPNRIKAVAALGGGINREFQKPEVREEIQSYSWNSLVAESPELLAERQKLMPEPERASEWIDRLKSMWAQNGLTLNEARQIKCPVLIVGGDREDHSPPEAYLHTYNSIPNSRLSIIPNAGLTDLIFDPEIMNSIVLPFILDFR